MVGEQRTLMDQLAEEERKRAASALNADGIDNEMKARFIEYHDANPHVFDAFCDLTLKTISKGFQHYGAKGIIELLRWHTGIDANDPDGFKINNNYAPFYARMFSAVFPQHGNFFRTRRSLAD